MQLEAHTQVPHSMNSIHVSTIHQALGYCSILMYDKRTDMRERSSLGIAACCHLDTDAAKCSLEKNRIRKKI